MLDEPQQFGRRLSREPETFERLTGTIVRQTKGPKINAFNYKAKKNERKQWGHRQPLTHVRVTGIEVK